MAQSSQAELESTQTQGKEAQSVTKMRRRKTSFTKLYLRTRSHPTRFLDFVQVRRAEKIGNPPRPLVSLRTMRERASDGKREASTFEPFRAPRGSGRCVPWTQSSELQA